MLKKCIKCREEKGICLFSKNKSKKDGLDSKCKECDKYLRLLNQERIKRYRKQNEKKHREYLKEYRKKNKDLLAKKKKEDYLLNKEKIAERSKKWYKKNKDIVIKKQTERQRNKRQTDPIYKFKKNVRSLIHHSFKRGTNQFSKKAKTELILGCNIEEFMIHIEKQFIDDMSFDNHGKWHLDHIIPLALASTKEEVIKLNHYSNFQPLWAEDNLKKSNKII